MLTDPFGVLSIRYPPVVYVNSSSHRFLVDTLFQKLRVAVNINYWWIPYASNCESGC
jgi:hypothetical protein